MTSSPQPSADVALRRSNRLPASPAISMQHYARSRYRTLRPEKMTVFSNRGPQPDDVYQGYIGNCWLMAALAALAHAQPQRLRDMIRPTHLPTVYEVRLFVPTDQGLRPRWVRVDTRIAVANRGEALYAQLTVERHSRRAILWPALIEKAFAKVLREDYREGYEALDANSTDRAFAMLTGSRTALVPLGLLEKDLLEHVLKDAPNQCTLVGSKLRGDTTAPLQPCHYYTVLGMNPRKRVQLRDPRGLDVEVSLPQLQALCDELAVADL